MRDLKNLQNKAYHEAEVVKLDTQKPEMHHPESQKIETLAETQEKNAQDVSRQIDNFVSQFGRCLILSGVFLIMLFMPLKAIFPILTSENFLNFYVENWQIFLLPAFFPFCLLMFFLIFKFSRQSNVLVAALTFYVLFGGLFLIINNTIDGIVSMFSLNSVVCQTTGYMLTLGMAQQHFNEVCADPASLVSSLNSAFALSFFMIVLYAFLFIALPKSKS